MLRATHGCQDTGCGPKGAVTAPSPSPWCSDDAGRSEDGGDAERLHHLPAAGQGGAGALVVVLSRQRLPLAELDGLPASTTQPGGARSPHP